MKDWIKELIDSECGFESEVKGFPVEQERFYLVRVGTDDYPCSTEDMDAIQKALATAAASFDEFKSLNKCIIVPHTVDMEEMTVTIKKGKE